MSVDFAPGGTEEIQRALLAYSSEFLLFVTRDGTITHMQNFFDCVRSRKEPNAPVEAGVAAARAGHPGIGLANTRARLEKTYGAHHRLTLTSVPGKGVTVIKVAPDDQVMAFLVSAKKDAKLQLETAKGKKLKVKDVRETIGKLTAVQMMEIVTKGKDPDMDAFGKDLAADMIKQIVEYYRGLAKK